MTDKHDQARPDAQAEARAIALDVFANAVDSDDDSHSMDMPVAIDIIAATLAAKDAELARIDTHRSKVIAENERLLNAHIDRDRQLAEANKALEQAARLAKSAWLEADIGTIADADAQSELCEWIAAAIRQLKELE